MRNFNINNANRSTKKRVDSRAERSKREQGPLAYHMVKNKKQARLRKRKVELKK